MILGGSGAHRDLLWILTVREIRIRYAQALLGVGWALFTPVVMMAVFTVLNFARLIPADSPYAAMPYTAFAYAGLLPWAHFATSLTQATPSLVHSRDLLRKSAFPQEVIPLSKVAAALFDLGIGMVFLLALMVWKGLPPYASCLAIPAVFLLQLAFTVGLALLLSSANMYFRDVNYLLQVGIVLAMFATSVVYPLQVSDPVARAVLSWNPMTSYIDAYREALLLGRWPGAVLVPGVVGAVFSFVIGTAVFRRLAPRLAEEV